MPIVVIEIIVTVGNSMHGKSMPKISSIKKLRIPHYESVRLIHTDLSPPTFTKVVHNTKVSRHGNYTPLPKFSVSGTTSKSITRQRYIG